MYIYICIYICIYTYRVPHKMIQHVFWLSLIGVHMYIYIYMFILSIENVVDSPSKTRNAANHQVPTRILPDHVVRFSFTPIYIYIITNVGKTIMNYPPNHHFYRWYKPFPNRWYTIVTIVMCPLNPTVNQVIKNPPRWECSMARVRHVRGSGGAQGQIDATNALFTAATTVEFMVCIYIYIYLGKL